MTAQGTTTVTCPDCGHEFTLAAAGAERAGRLTEAAAPGPMDAELYEFLSGLDIDQLETLCQLADAAIKAGDTSGS